MRDCMRKVILFLTAFLVIPITAQANTFEISVADKGSVCVIAGEIYVVSSPEQSDSRDWSKARLSEHTSFKVQGSRWAGRYLTADPDKGTIGLARFAARDFPAGSLWQLTHDEESGTWLLQVTTGKYKGWYLDMEEERKSFKDGDRAYTAYPLKLSKRPGRHSRMRIEGISR